MRNIKICMILMVSFLFLNGCASTRIAMMPQITPFKDGNGVDRVFSDGNPIAVSTIGKTSVIAQLAKKEDYLVLNACYKNLSANRIDIDPTSVTVDAYDKRGSVEKLKVYSAKEVGDSIRAKQMVKAVASTAGSVLSLGLSTLAVVGMPTTPSYLGGTASGAYTAMAAGGIAQQALSTQMGVQHELMLAASATEYGMLKMTTLFPNQYAEGGICIKKKDAEKYVISIPFGNTVHAIEFVPTKMK